MSPEYRTVDLHLDHVPAHRRAAVVLRRVGAGEGRVPDHPQPRIGEGGLDLSAGEKQLLAFARALCRNPAVLILDEATSSVDSEAERLLEEAVQTSFAERTVLVIAHRLSTIVHADQILVLDQGHIVQRGQHEELLDQGGLYRKLHQMQFRDD